MTKVPKLPERIVKILIAIGNERKRQLLIEWLSSIYVPHKPIQAILIPAQTGDSAYRELLKKTDSYDLLVTDAGTSLNGINLVKDLRSHLRKMRSRQTFKTLLILNFKNSHFDASDFSATLIEPIDQESLTSTLVKLGLYKRWA